MAVIKLNLSLINITGKKDIKLNIQDPKKLTEIISEMGISQFDVGMVIKNSRWAPLSCTIEEDDVVQLFPHLEGG